MLIDLGVAKLFLTIVVSVGKKQQMLQYKDCTNVLFAKHTSRHRHHLEGCYNFLQHQKNIQEENVITRQVEQDKIHQLFLCIVTFLKRRQLD